MSVFISILVILFIVYSIKGRQAGVPNKSQNWYLQMFFSKEDVIIQFLFLFSVAFLCLTLLALNKDLNGDWSWRTIILFSSIIGLGF